MRPPGTRTRPRTRPPRFPRPHLRSPKRRPWGRARLIPRTSRAEAATLQVIVAWKAAKAAILFAVGLTLFALIGRDLGEIAHRAAELLHLDVHRRFLEELFERLAALKTRQVAKAGGAAIVYGCVLAIEAVGLAERRAWAAWLAVLVGAALLPAEVWELVHRPRGRIGLALLANAAVVWYLYREARRARGPRTKPFRWHPHPHPPSHPVSGGSPS